MSPSNNRFELQEDESAKKPDGGQIVEEEPWTEASHITSQTNPLMVTAN